MMNANSIATADMLDILFDGRNKAYGAYSLRRTYNKRLAIALSVVLLATLLIFSAQFIKKNGTMIARGVEIGEDTLRLRLYKPTPPPKAIPQQNRIRQLQYTEPVITKDADMVEGMPQVTEIENAAIGTADEPGAPDDGSPAATNSNASNVIPAAAPIHEIPEDTVFRMVENPAEFAGDWKRFLERNLVYPDQAIENETQGVVKVQFIVDKNGNISDITALNDPGDGLAEEAMRIIKRSHWKPAEQNGHKVNYLHMQTIIFRLQN